MSSSQAERMVNLKVKLKKALDLLMNVSDFGLHGEGCHFDENPCNCWLVEVKAFLKECKVLEKKGER